MPDLLASEASDIALEVSKKLNLLLRNLVPVHIGLSRSFLFVRVIHLHY